MERKSKVNSVVTTAGFAGKNAIFVSAAKTLKQYHFSLSDVGKLEFLGFLSVYLSRICPRQGVKRPVGFVCDSVLLVVWNMD